MNCDKKDINNPSLLRERFDDSGRTVKAYARAKGLCSTTLSRVLNGVTNGERSTKEGKTRKVFCHLKKDAIYIGKLPWEKEEISSKKVA